MSNNTPYMKVNDSDKIRGSGNILPGEQAHTGGDGEGGCGEKMKQHKFKIIIGVVILIVAIILGVTLSGGSSDKPGPAPTPPGPNPGPTPGPGPPINSGYNPYFLNATSNITMSKNKVNGILFYDLTHANTTLREGPNGADLIKPLNLTTSPQGIPTGENNEWIKHLEYDFSQVDYKITKVMFTDALKERFSINETLVGSKKDSSNMTLDNAGFKLYDEPFGFEFRSTRQPNVVNVYTNSSDFVMQDKFMQLDLQMPSSRIYGLGERQREFSLVPGTWTMWANGGESQYDNGSGGKQTYGVHPFALVQTQQKDEWMGIFFRNSNAQSPIINTKEDGNTTLSYITTGGTLEMYFFTKGSSKEIIQAYHNMIGKPTLTPFWSLGLQVVPAKAGDIQAFDAVIKKFKDDGTPLEGLFLDVPYLSEGADFTVNTTTFPNLKVWSQNLKKNNQKLSVVLDGSLSSDNFENYYYSQASLQEVLLKSAINPGWLTNTVWSKKSVFLDFMNDQAAMIWMHGINALFDEVEFDGLWLDMNEATGLCDGECVNGFIKTSKTSEKRRSLKEKIFENTAEFIDREILEADEDKTNHTWYYSWETQVTNSTFQVPFSPGQKNLDQLSLSLNATHVDGSSEYNLHSLFGHAQGMQTHRILSDITYNPKTPLRDLRTFILSRSTFAGSGQYVQHWLGESKRNWDSMRWATAGIMNFNMFGIPMVGPDICGSIVDKLLNQTEQDELCARWLEVGSFYPLARYRIPSALQLGGTEANPTLYGDMASKAMEERFYYLRHMYTCQLRVHRDGGTCFDPLLMHYPHDDNVFATNQTEHTFLVGDAIKVTPVLKSGAINVTSYFPTGQWVSLRDYKIVTSAAPAPAGGQYMTLDATNGINAHLRPGYMVPKEACNKPLAENSNNCSTTTDLRANGKLSMIANRDTQGHAVGELFIDSGDTHSEILTQTYEYYQFQLSAGSIKKWVLNEKNSGPVGNGISSFVIANAKELLSINFACWVSEADNSATPLKIGRNATLNTVTISNMDDTPIQPFYVKNIYFGNSNTDLNLCGKNGTNGTDSAAMEQFYTLESVPSLKGNNATINITGNHAKNQAQPDLSIILQVLNTKIDGKEGSDIDILNIQWTYTDHTTSAKMPYTVPLEIAGCDKTILSDEGKLQDWINIVHDNDTKSFEIVVEINGKPIFTLSNKMSFGEYVNIIQGVAHTYVDPTDKTGFKGLMGLSQQTTSDLFLDSGMYSLWARDPVDPQETVRNPDQNGYSTHPFVMARGLGQQDWFGMFANNAAAQDWWITNNAADGNVGVKIMATGGIGDLYFFQGQNPQRLTEAYHRIVGRPVVTPQWALGWHQSQWGYKNTGAIKKVADGFFEYNFPLEALWADIDYMQDFKDFTVDQKDFGDLGQYMQGLNATNNVKFVPIIDAGIAQRLPQVDNYTVYNEGKKDNVFIKSGALNKYDYQLHQFTGQTWAGDAAFVDFTAENAQTFWSRQLDNLAQNLSYSMDGVWLNSNEASNQLCNGVCYDDQRAENPVQWNIPYIPTGGNLETHAIQLDATHTDQLTELDVHSLYGTMETMATNTWFKDQKKRPMIIERSSYAGLGKFGSQWLGDNYSKPEYMGFSVVGTMAHNIAGIPLVGADICGFAGDSNAELCARWYTVGAFYPFSRNHNSIDSAPQLPWTFNTVYMGTVTYDQIIRQAMYTKLNLIRYYYTQMSLVQENGGAFYRPLFYDFPNDINAYDNQELNIMLGPALKLGIQSRNFATTEFYYPAGRYCSVFCKKEADCCVSYATGTSVPSPSYAFSFNLDLIAGNIVPMQDAIGISEKVMGDMKNMTTAYLQKEPVEIHIMPNCIGTVCIASGDYINDDGFTTDMTERKQFSFLYSHTVTTVGAAPDKLTLNITSTGFEAFINENDLLGGIQIYDYTNMNITGSEYIVNATIEGAKEPLDLGSTTFSQVNDRLVWKFGDSGLFQDLRFVSSITFTKKVTSFTKKASN